jgi:hypothetical protein
MSDIQDSSEFQNEECSPVENVQFDSMGVIGENEEKIPVQSLNEIKQSLDGQSYFLGEVPQSYLVDPQGFLPLNSDRMVDSANAIEPLIADAGSLLREEVAKIQGFQKKINFWEDRIEKNKTAIAANDSRVKQNNIDMVFDKKNRDYWWGRAEQVSVDYSYAEAANRADDWVWLIKKYGLKNADGSPINPSLRDVEEFCNGVSNNLVGEYKMAGDKYEHARRDREVENHRLIHESSHLKGLNDTLKGYIAATYTKEIEPLQEGVILLKELSAMLQSLSQNSQATFGDLRSWAEPFINEFIKTNTKVPQLIVTEFRKLASIPLPAQNS